MIVNPLSPAISVADKQPNKAVQKTKAAASKAKPDTVQLSPASQAKSLQLQGFTPNQIAARMALTIEVVNSYLGISLRGIA